MAKNPQCHGKSKHIEIKFHYVREQVRKEVIKLIYCQTINMVADILTKGLSKDPHQRLATLIGVC